MITAEPGDPADGETYGDGHDRYVACHSAYFEGLLRDDGLRRAGKAAPFHRNMRKILDLCFPETTLEHQLRATWIMDAVLCSARVSGGSVDRLIEEVCVRTYLAKVIEALPNAFVFTLGGKALRRMKRQHVRVDGWAQHPSAWPSTKPEQNWQRVAGEFRSWLENKDRIQSI